MPYEIFSNFIIYYLKLKSSFVVFHSNLIFSLSHYPSYTLALNKSCFSVKGDGGFHSINREPIYPKHSKPISF